MPNPEFEGRPSNVFYYDRTPNHVFYYKALTLVLYLFLPFRCPTPSSRARPRRGWATLKCARWSKTQWAQVRRTLQAMAAFPAVRCSQSFGVSPFSLKFQLAGLKGYCKLAGRHRTSLTEALEALQLVLAASAILKP